ncbi:PmoA family protein [Chryseolinea lacunae]|uniref:PmoA family protein n=1 Tax=Chryseolinea lacunae TaxID=2801331 RepID=A0ABS1KPU5_9BACT|nr:PmoA family protein [Chryseolinea lacunae]MBL0741494.1 PmoA family protein [Chryseolinea lacunae]
MKKPLLFFVMLLLQGSLLAQKKGDGFRFIDHMNEKQIDVTYDGKLLTSYYYADSVMKPVLYPINSLGGVTVTRGFPLAPRPGERVDHPHHIGLWMNYEYVNGLDFWNNSTAIPFKERAHYGSIVHQSVLKNTTGKNSADLEVSAHWVDRSGKTLLNEVTHYTFRVDDDNFIIDRSSTLTAVVPTVAFNDVKDGFLGIRVARQLEHPSTEPEIFVDNKGNYTSVPAINNDGITGEYLSSEGKKGNDVWGTRGTWTSLRGKINRVPVSITIFDHPKNVGYPTYWHARGYGLFAANPLGQAVFSKGTEKLNFALKKDESTTFRYRVVIRSGSELSTEAIQKLSKDFSKVK